MEQQIGGAGLGPDLPGRGPCGLGDLGDTDALVQPGTEQRCRERVQVGLPGQLHVKRFQASRGRQQQRRRLCAAAGGEGQLGAEQIDLRSL
ncbi:hypothetical protein ACIA5D_39505 [Actinoplanes sp. NPDC051513]|uniref:hypothetical protein n=1 Tax=Actinoplanes sp. NPDC051513 TaxID=3363908 RepID=UPI003797EB14